MSQLSDALSAALAEFCSEPHVYSELYERYMGIPMDPPDVSDAPSYPEEVLDGSGLQKVLERGVVRVGTWARAPYVWEEDGELTGWEYELMEVLVAYLAVQYGCPNLRIDWVLIDVAAPLDGSDAKIVLSDHEDDLEADGYDVAISGILMPATKTAEVTRHAQFVLGGLYTGAGGFGAPPYGDEAGVVQFFARQGVTIEVCSSFGDKQSKVAEGFVNAIIEAAEQEEAWQAEALEGVPRARRSELFIPEIVYAIETGTRHVYIGDSLQNQFSSASGGAPYDFGLNMEGFHPDDDEILLDVRAITQLDPWEEPPEPPGGGQGGKPGAAAGESGEE